MVKVEAIQQFILCCRYFFKKCHPILTISFFYDIIIYRNVSIEVIFIKRITIKDVAREAGTSISAVSYVLNNSTEKKYSETTVKRIKEAAKKLNYTPNNIARGMRSQKAYSIGIVNFWNIYNHVFVKSLNGIVEVANEYKYSVVLCPVSNKNVNDYSYIDYVINRRVDGIVLIAPVQSECVIDEQEHINRMKKAGVPFVVINTSLNTNEPNFFRYDFSQAVYTATEYLFSNGHRDIAYVTPNISDTYPEMLERLNGYKQAVKELGLNTTVYNIDDIDFNTMNKLSAVVTNKTDTAKKFIDKAIDFGFSIPDQISIVAANAENYSEYLYVPLTCSQIPISTIARMAAKMLIDIINDKSVEKIDKISCEIVDGKSVKKY